MGFLGQEVFAFQKKPSLKNMVVGSRKRNPFDTKELKYSFFLFLSLFQHKNLCLVQ